MEYIKPSGARYLWVRKDAWEALEKLRQETRVRSKKTKSSKSQNKSKIITLYRRPADYSDSLMIDGPGSARPYCTGDNCCSDEDLES